MWSILLFPIHFESQESLLQRLTTKQSEIYLKILHSINSRHKFFLNSEILLFYRVSSQSDAQPEQQAHVFTPLANILIPFSFLDKIKVIFSKSNAHLRLEYRKDIYPSFAHQASSFKNTKKRTC